MSIRITPTVIFAFALAIVSAPSLSDPPPGKGQSGNNQASEGSNAANASKNAKGSNESKGSKGSKGSESYQSHTPTGFVANDLISAGITLVAARELAIQSGTIGYQPLPPGIAKNLARGKPLPPGIAKRNAPESLLQGLPRHVGYEWLRAGTDLLLVNTASRVISDVLVNALR